MKTVYSVGIFLLTLIVATSCNPTDEPQGEQFDRGEMLENFTQNLIIPNFNSAHQWSSELRFSVNSLVNSPNISLENLQEAQAVWQEAYTQYLKVSMYNFGPAGEETIRKSLVEEVATFPVNVSRVIAKTQTENPNFGDFERDSRGYLALDYLLFNDDALNNLQSNANYRNYTLKVAEDIEKRLEQVNEQWKSYQTGFVTNNGTDAGSSTSALYNEFVKSYEGLKNFKVGLPLGLRPGQSQSEPEKVEALYSGLSLEFIKVQFNEITNVWKGGSGLGFDDYLEKVEGGPTLAVSTKEQISVIENELGQFSSATALSDLIRNDEAKVRSLHTELQKNTRFFKSELSSLLGIAITFTSGDGD